MDETTRLLLALVASRYGGARLVARVRKSGISAFTDLLNEISKPELEHADAEAHSLSAQGIGAVLLGSPQYPDLLASIRVAPPFLFYLGALDLLNVHGIGVCGSRNASDEGLRAAAACGEAATQQGLTVVSGYARGIDMATHVSALFSGGGTIIVLPEGINHFRVKRGPIANVWDPSRTVVVSQFSPGRPWSPGNAMTRNDVIIGLSQALVVVEASDKGGTLAAGIRALQLNRRVFALEFSETPRGNTELMLRGAVSVRNGAELRRRLAEVAEDPAGNQLSII